MTTDRENKATQPIFRDRKFLKMGLLFCSLVVILDLLVWYLGRREYLAFVDIFTSYVIAGLIQLSDLPVLRDSNTIYLTNAVWIVTTECTALFIMLIFSSFVMVFPSSIKAKLVGIAAGIPVIFSANILRLYMMAWIDYLRPQFSEYFHNYVWQVFFILMIIFMWLFWIDRIVKPGEIRQEAGSVPGKNP